MQYSLSLTGKEEFKRNFHLCHQMAEWDTACEKFTENVVHPFKYIYLKIRITQSPFYFIQKSEETKNVKYAKF